jgi:hypothetical protein
MLRVHKSRLLFLLAVFALAATFSASASKVSGTVTNKTTGKPSDGDTIAAINLSQGMDEIAKATSDSHGRYHLTVPDGGQILLHVTHKGAEYFARVPPGSSSVDIDVYDSATRVDGISGEATVMQMETDTAGRTLNVTANMSVSNASLPAMTQYGGNTFDFYLPKNAVIVESLASAPGGMPTQSPVKTLDANGHYAFTFPVRPGETRFQVSYTMPYSGKQAFAIKQTLPTADVAVMLPKSIQFQGNGPTQFQAINDDVSLQTFDAHQPAFSQPVEFTLSGTGQLPQAQDETGNGGQGGADQSGGATGSTPSQMGGSGANGTGPGGGLGTPIDTPGPLTKYQWWILGALALALVAGAGFLLSSRPPAHATAVAASNTGGGQIMNDPTSQYYGGASLGAIKDELFQLETERLHGKLTEEQYAMQKGALDILMRRILARHDQNIAGTPIMSESPFQSVGDDGHNMPGNAGDPTKT